MDTKLVLAKSSTLAVLLKEEELILKTIAIDVLHALLEQFSTQQPIDAKQYKPLVNVLAKKDTIQDQTLVLPAHQVK
jgi:hypothetical protein